MAMILLTSAGLLGKSFWSLLQMDPGFHPDHVLSFRLSLPNSRYPENVQREAFFREVADRLKAVSGVQSVGATNRLPLGRGQSCDSFALDDRPPFPRNEEPCVESRTVTAEYRSTMQIRLAAGRELDARDVRDAAPVVMINQAMADQQWPDEDPIGKRFNFFGQEFQREVVGLVATAKLGTLGEEPQPVAFMPRNQNYRNAMTLIARGQGDSQAMLGTLRKEMQALDPALAITGVQTVQEAVGQSLWTARMAAGLLGILGGLALVLAAIGLYGVMSHAASQRSREVGIRMAMGADRMELVGLVLRRGMLLSGAGLVLGVGVALFVTRGMASLLYGVSTSDPRTYLVTLGLLLLVALLANLLPARRATRVDPVKVLRAER